MIAADGIPSEVDIGRRRCLAALGAIAWPVETIARDAMPPRDDIKRRIEELAPGHSMELGHAAVLGNFNETARTFGLQRTGPRARDYCRRMAWAPARHTALFAGANHGSPHRLNDVWEFNLGAFAWVMLYAPDLPRGYGNLGKDASDVVYVDGNLVTKRGGPAVIGHTWSGLTWDARRHCMLFMATWPVDVDAMVRGIGGDPSQRDRSPPLWAFDPITERWSRWTTKAPWPKAAVAALLQDVPELHGQIWHLNSWQLRGTWLLHDEDRRWEPICDAKIQPDFESQAPGQELVGYHDPVRHLVVTQCRQRTFHFDTTRRRWSEKTVAGAPRGFDTVTTFVRDPASGGGMLIDFKLGQLWSYDPDALTWKLLSPTGPPMPMGQHTLGYADEDFGVIVIIDDTAVWICRPPGAASSRTKL
jgi:hypothetical protein